MAHHWGWVSLLHTTWINLASHVLPVHSLQCPFFLLENNVQPDLRHFGLEGYSSLILGIDSYSTASGFLTRINPTIFPMAQVSMHDNGMTSHESEKNRVV